MPQNTISSQSGSTLFLELEHNVADAYPGKPFLELDVELAGRFFEVHWCMLFQGQIDTFWRFFQIKFRRTNCSIINSVFEI